MMGEKLDADLPCTTLQPEHSAVGTRKSSFVITDILRSDDEPDDADTTLHSSLLAHQTVASEVTESPKRAQTLDGGLSWISPPVVTGMSLNDSRFRIVKIESRDRWHRGRWTCHDFADPPEHVKTEQMVENDNAASKNRNGPSIYYIPGVQDALRSPFGIVYNTGGHPVLEANLLSPRYARGSRFFSSNLAAFDNASGDMPESEMTGVHFSSQGISAVDELEPAGHSAVRKLFPSDDSNVFVPLEVSVSQSGHNNTEDTKSNESLVSRQLSSVLLTTADHVQKTAGQTSPLDVMMSATLGPSSSEPDMR